MLPQVRRLRPGVRCAVVEPQPAPERRLPVRDVMIHPPTYNVALFLLAWNHLTRKWSPLRARSHACWLLHQLAHLGRRQPAVERAVADGAAAALSSLLATERDTVRPSQSVATTVPHKFSTLFEREERLLTGWVGFILWSPRPTCCTLVPPWPCWQSAGSRQRCWRCWCGIKTAVIPHAAYIPAAATTARPYAHGMVALLSPLCTCSCPTLVGFACVPSTEL